MGRSVMRWFIGVLVFIFLGCFRHAGAQEMGEGIESYRLDEVVITGTRTEKRLSEVPVRTEIVTREEIEKTHARDLKEALEDVPGLILRLTHGRQGQEVWMQGFDSDRVLILLNGERLTASTGSTVDLTQISTADIERIEIVKGATSALYGSDAMGGVINVITRQPVKPISLTLEIDGGSYGDKNTGGEPGSTHFLADMSLKRPHWNIQLTPDIRLSRGFDLDKSTLRTDGDEGLRWNLNSRITLTPAGGSEIYLSPRFYREEKERLVTTFTPGLGDILRNRMEKADRWHVSLGGKIPIENGSLLAAALAFERFEDMSSLDVVASPQLDQERTAVINLYRGELQWDFPVGERQIITAGANAGQETLEQEQVQKGASGTTAIQEIIPGAKRENYEAYLQDDIFLTPWLELLPGGRYQLDSDFGSFMAPKINLMIRPASFMNLRLGYGKGYRVPNLKERFYFFDHSALGYQVIGNPDLEPEESDSLQAEIELWSGRVFHGEVNLFYNRIENLIDTRLNPVKSVESGLQIFDYQNVLRARTLGMEAAASLSFWHYFTFTGGYTYLDAKDTELDKWLPGRPKHQVKGGLDIDQDKWGTTFSLRAVYQGKEFVDSDNTTTSPAWTTIDAKLNQEVWKHTTLFVGADNILDVHRSPGRSEFDDLRPVTGRFIYAGMRIRM